MADSKRKEHPTTGRDDRGGKRSKGGSGGKWQTPHQLARAEKKIKIEAGDQGIWATCVKGKEGKCVEELKILFDDYAERLYGVRANDTTEDLSGEDEDDDNIAASIQKEIAAMNAKEPESGKQKLFTSVRLDIPCVLFFKTRKPVEPVEFVRKICLDAMDGEPRRSRFVNRLTPMVMMGKATEKGLEDVGKAVLGEVFGAIGENRTDDSDAQGAEAQSALTYAIRPTIRANSSLKRDAVIKQVANMVPSHHKVDLTAPDKVIIVEIYQAVCGMSVVGSDWEKLKRFNLAEAYPSLSKKDAVLEKSKPGAGNEDEANTKTTGEAMTNIVQKDEAVPLSKADGNDESPDS